MTADRLEPAESKEEFLARTLPLPAIDIAGFDSGSAQVYEDTTRRGAREGPPRPGRAGLAKIARGGAVNLAGAVISAASSVGLTIVVTRNFGKSVVGTFFVATSLFLIVEAVTNLGAFNGAIYFIARLRALQADRRIPAIVRATVFPVAVSSVVGAIGLAVFAYPLARLLLVGRLADGVSAAGVATSLRVLAAALPFAALTDTFLGATRGYHEMRPTVLVDRVGRSGLQMLGVTLAALAGSSALLAPLWALPYIPTAVVGLFWLRAIMRRYRSRLRLASRSPRPAPVQPGDRLVYDNRHGKPNARGFWRFTTPRSIASVAQIVIQRLDIVLVGVMKGPVDAAIYTAATRFLVAGQLGNAAISMSAQPQLTRLFAIGDRAAANTVYQVTTAWLILLTWPLYLLAAVFGPSILTVFGRTYHAGSTVMIILALAMLVATACGQVDMVLITTGRSTWSLYNGLLAMAVNIGMDIALIPAMGITGAAIGWATAIALTNLIPLVQVATAAKVHPFGSGVVAACGLTAVSFGLIPLALRAAAGPGPAVLLAATAIGCAVLALGLWPLRHALRLSAMPGLDWIGRLSRRSRTA